MTSASTDDKPDPAQLTVYFDGACPLCRREINIYRSLRGADSIAWVDVSSQHNEQLGSDLTRDAALKRFHVRRHDGRLASGAAAFAHLWMALPLLSWPGRLLSLSGIRHAAEVFYRGFLAVRPLLQRLTPR